MRKQYTTDPISGKKRFYIIDDDGDWLKVTEKRFADSGVPWLHGENEFTKKWENEYIRDLLLSIDKVHGTTVIAGNLNKDSLKSKEKTGIPFSFEKKIEWINSYKKKVR